MKRLEKNYEETSKNEIKVFTDGSCIKKKSGILCGYGVHYPNKEYNDFGRPFTHVPLTNQRAELYAIYKGIQRIHKRDKYVNIIIYSDSEYSIKSLTIWIKQWKLNGWKTAGKKPVLNQDLIIELDSLLSKHNGKIKFVHVKAHTNGKDYESIHNDIADGLAKTGANLTNF